MSEIALTEYEEARNIQQTQNDARRIRTRVEAARNDPARAGIRWPFEIMQNAHDAGPRNDVSLVEVKFALEGDKLEVSHNGMPFTAPELAALLSGGSSKEFDGEETTGRFGTGFMVTHCLSTHVDVSGVIKTKEGYEQFSINLDRDGDEESITDNIREAGAAVSNAKFLSEIEVEHISTATFVYHDVNGDAAQRGLLRLEETIPYLYATCDKLGQVRIERDHETTVFEPSEREPNTIDGFILNRTDIRVSQSDGIQQLAALRISGKNTESSRLLIVLEKIDDGQYRVVLPNSEFPKVFVKFPIVGTNFLPFNVVLDGKFAPQQERDGIAMHEADKTIAKDSLSALPAMAQYAVKSGWGDAHKLANLAIPNRTISEDSNELNWWKETLLEIAEATASKPIVTSEEGLLPALSNDGKNVSFMMPAVDTATYSDTAVDYDEIHELASKVSDLFLPRKAIAQDWGQIATKWDDLGLPVSRLGLSELTDQVKSKGHSISELPVKDPFSWLGDLLHLVSTLPEKISISPIVSGLMPDQHSNLRSPRGLRIDNGIPEEVKSIADSIGIDLRSSLLHNTLARLLSEPGYEDAKNRISDLLDKPYTKNDAIAEILAKLNDCLPTDREFEDDSDLTAVLASARLITHLFLENDSDQRIRECPLVAEDNTLVRLPNNLQILAPVPCWPASHEHYADLYTKNRILSSIYFNDSELKGALQHLTEGNFVIPAPLYKGNRALIEDGNLLKAMSSEDIEPDSITVRNQSFGQIAFLATELVNRCGHDIKLAKLLLDFVLNVAANEDQNWSEVNIFNGNRAGERLELKLYGASWPYELKVRSWVPVPIDDGKSFSPGPATEGNLRELLNPAWLKNNPSAIELLHRVFGFKKLALMVENLEPEVESSLVTLLQDQALVKSAVANLDVVRTAVENPETVRLLSEVGPEEIQQIRAEIRERNQQAQMRERNRNFGHAVQEAVAEAVRKYGFTVDLDDRGYDYAVSLDDAEFSFIVGSYFLEVKATTTRDVRITPTQAKVASNHEERFVLCVVDLYGEQIKETWEPADVSQHVKIARHIGRKVKEIYEDIDGFSNSENLVHLRNEQMLRYGISTKLWEHGISIDKWAQHLKTQIVPH